ncbi:L-aspartate oxidase [Planococcus sp. CP5-4]|uniref:L-aspartate oxidase n=1 Tax=unclassified Planococcus (in: firmicutes) TaxID=2662419 RepID=UPI001C24CE8D|nr:MULTISPECIES: L-aspartate oxidase [unclassified Planococcus (in: firmicutes)]MBU9674746.1 L-aspartate oxidase [Planococcus sp. CP5-4_YE]MBV0910333.1 L-aspartate oxidase [Planococcus sp. CP5-4_UN]MBW6063891.1 L-aspartate oxidase [Planococcus sp. CP5-4]
MFDVCIIGGGVAGLMLARSLPDNYSIAIVTKEHAGTGNTSLAQGGIAASLSFDDRPESHAADTLLASAGHADAGRVDILVNEGSELMKNLLVQGLPFDGDEFGLPALGMEGAHSHRRIVHAGGDQTGKMLMHYLMEETYQKITRFAFHQALELRMEHGRCTGVLVSDRSGKRSVVQADHIVLATGGIGQLYSATSNSSVSTGDGLSLAYHAGAVLEDLEFVQFHPTVLTLEGKSCGLISEAVRGEGAVLVAGNGKRVMDGIHPLMELAPRDIVARAIERHWQTEGPVFLDARQLADFQQRFPSIYENCRNHTIDPTEALLPVRPGAHFHMGGVRTDSYGQTSIPGLYAVGEVASTGVHGANRLASNSLLEGLVFARRLAERISGEQETVGITSSLPQAVDIVPSTYFESLDEDHLKRNMTETAGILREPYALQNFLQAHPLKGYVLKDYTDELIAQIHRQTASSLIATAALLRKESRGGHYRIDAPETKPEWAGKVIGISNRGVQLTTRKTKIKETI